MQNILIFGAGNIGATIGCILAHSRDYQVYLADSNLETINSQIKGKQINNLTLIKLDVTDSTTCQQFIHQHGITALVTCLPYSLTIQVAELAKATDCHYFDLTEDTKAAVHIKELAAGAKQAFVPQCGLAPGLINIIANDLLQQFSEPEEAKLRCGGLPQNSCNPLHYALTWSVDGLINEYANACYGIINGKKAASRPLDDIEVMQIDGLNYEAFNTSGGIGSLIESYRNKIEMLNYKSIRYPGHCEKMRFLMDGLKLNQDRETLKRILKNVIPTTKQDVVIVYVSVKGKQGSEYVHESYVKKFYPTELAGLQLSAMQATTACSASAVIDTVLTNATDYHGHIKQESFSLEQIHSNRFGKYFCENHKPQATIKKKNNNLKI